MSTENALRELLDQVLQLGPRVSSFHAETPLLGSIPELDSMAQGKSFIASDVGGHKELIQHEKTGLLFKAGDPLDLTRAVHRLLTDPTLRHGLTLAGRNFVETERTWQNSVHRYLPLYQRLLAHPRP